MARDVGSLTACTFTAPDPAPGAQPALPLGPRRRGRSTPEQGVSPRALPAPQADLSLAFRSPPTSLEEERARTLLVKHASDCLQAAWSAGTLMRYNTALRVTIGGVESAVGSEMLPVDSEEKFMAIFSSMVGCSWSSILVNRAAVGAWHSAAGAPGWVAEDSST